MLDSNDRRPAFDRWYASLSTAERTLFLAAAEEQRASLDTGTEPTSLIDCMENVWDEIRSEGWSPVIQAYGV